MSGSPEVCKLNSSISICEDVSSLRGKQDYLEITMNDMLRMKVVQSF